LSREREADQEHAGSGWLRWEPTWSWTTCWISVL